MANPNDPTQTEIKDGFANDARVCGIAYSEKEDVAWVTDVFPSRTAARIYKVDVATKKATELPMKQVVDNQISFFAQGAQVALEFNQAGNAPYPVQRVWMTDNTASVVYYFPPNATGAGDTNSVDLSPWGPGATRSDPALGTPFGLAVDHDAKRVWVADQAKNAIFGISTDDPTQDPTVVVLDQAPGPYLVAVDQGRVFHSNYNDGTIGFFKTADPTQHGVHGTVKKNTNPTALQLRDGKLWFITRATRQLFRIDAPGDATSAPQLVNDFSQDLGPLRDLVIDEAGFIWIFPFTGKIVQLYPDGKAEVGRYDPLQNNNAPPSPYYAAYARKKAAPFRDDILYTDNTLKHPRVVDLQPSDALVTAPPDLSKITLTCDPSSGVSAPDTDVGPLTVKTAYGGAAQGYAVYLFVTPDSVATFTSTSSTSKVVTTAGNTNNFATVAVSDLHILPGTIQGATFQVKGYTRAQGLANAVTLYTGSVGDSAAGLTPSADSQQQSGRKGNNPFPHILDVQVNPPKSQIAVTFEVASNAVGAVSFEARDPAKKSITAHTDSEGHAYAQAFAGDTVGAADVKATSGSQSTTFKLTVTPVPDKLDFGQPPNLNGQGQQSNVSSVLVSGWDNGRQVPIPEALVSIILMAGDCSSLAQANDRRLMFYPSATTEPDGTGEFSMSALTDANGRAYFGAGKDYYLGMQIPANGNPDLTPFGIAYVVPPQAPGDKEQGLFFSNNAAPQVTR
jgi:hypothetical protein